MANLNKLLLAGGFPPGNNSLNHFEKLFAQKVGDSGVITTATGNPVSIITNKAQNAISTLLSYSPKQSGSGDPSPQNIRPIEGWTEANLGVNSETPTKTISLGGTYYGFEIDVENGTASIGYAEFDLGNFDWVYSGTIFYASNLRPISPKPLFAGKVYCPIYKNQIVPLTNPTNNTIYIANSVDNPIIRVADNRYSDADIFKSAITGVKIVCQIVTPQTIPLTPQIVTLLKGNNTLWTDGDSIEITYKAKKQ